MGPFLPCQDGWQATEPNLCASSRGLFIQLHSSGFQLYHTLLLRSSDVPKPPPSLSVTFNPNLFTLTSSSISLEILSANVIRRYRVFSGGIMERILGGWRSGKLIHYWWLISSHLWFWPSQTWVESSQSFLLWHWAMWSQQPTVHLWWQSVSHIINNYPVNKFEGGLATLHTTSDSAREWLLWVHCIR